MAKGRYRQLPYTLEEKIAFVTKVDQLYRAGGVTMSAALAAAGTNAASYASWVKAGIRPSPPRAAVTVPHVRSPEEREQLVAEVDRLRDGGMGVQAACRQAGITDKSYRKWKEDLAPPPAMRPVEVTALVPVGPTAMVIAPPRPAPEPVLPAARPATGDSLVLVAPGGYRLEGLGVETAAALLRALA